MLDSRAVVFVLAAFVYLGYPSVTEGKLHRVHACEGHYLSLKCTSGNVLHILDAGYGRRNSTICYYFSDPQPDFRPCQSATAPDIIRAYCDGQSSCKLRAKNANFQDPCPGQVKYAEVMYNCVPAKSFHKVH